MALSPKKRTTSLERKLKELEQEKERVQHEIKSLAKAMKKGDLPSPPPPPRPAPASNLPPRLAPDPRPVDPFDDPFKNDPLTEAQPPLGIPRKASVYGDERFANYFSTGGFKSSPLPARQDRSVQRNKAIFMVALVVIVGYIIYSVFLR
jgi:hypothetical protein